MACTASTVMHRQRMDKAPYATTSHVAGFGTSTTMQDLAIRPTNNSSSASEFNPLEYMHHGNYVRMKEESGSTRNPLTAPQCSTVFPQQQAPRKSYCMVSEAFDHVVPYGRPAGPQQFLTSDQCAGCHDATGTISGTWQRLTFPPCFIPMLCRPATPAATRRRTARSTSPPTANGGIR